jgi:hypothetical protein
MRLLAIDLGYSNVKVAYYNESGALQFDKFISAVAKVDDPMELDNDVMFQLGADTYVLGASALKLSRSLLLNLETFEDLKTIYPVWISYLLTKYGGVDKFDKVVVGLSMAFSDKADELLTHLYDTLLIQRENYFICLPQGLSCKLGYSMRGLDIRETSTGHSGSSELKNYIILDGGFLTTDFCTVIGSKASAGAAIGLPQTGLIRVVYDIIDYLYKTYQMKVSVKEAQNYLDSDGIFVRRGRKFDISEKVKEFTKNYLGNVLTLLEEKYGEYIDAADGILILGGLAYFFQKYSDDPDVKAEIEKHFSMSFLHWPVEHSEFYNSFSYLKAAEKLLEE